MNELKAFLLRNNITHREFAEKIGTTIGTLNGIVNGKRLPSLKLALRIETGSLHCVTVYDWILDTEKKKQGKNTNAKRKKNNQT